MSCGFRPVRRQTHVCSTSLRLVVEINVVVGQGRAQVAAWQRRDVKVGVSVQLQRIRRESHNYSEVRLSIFVFLVHTKYQQKICQGWSENIYLIIFYFITTVKAPKFGPQGNFGPLFQKGLLSLKRVLQKNEENKSC